MELRENVVPENRKNPLWFEADGDFNPGWFLFISFAVLGAIICVGALVALILHPASWQLGVAALSFITFAMLCTAIIVVPIARAKLLTRLRGAVGDVASVASGGAVRLEGTDRYMEDDER